MSKIPPKNPPSGSNDGALLSPLERYLAKQRQDRAAQAAKEAAAAGKSPSGGLRGALGQAGQKATGGLRGAPVSASGAGGRAGGGFGGGANEKPSLSGVERPPSNAPSSELSQPASLRRWEAVADERLSESELRARESGAPAVPPLAPAGDRVSPITDRQLVPDGLRPGEFGPRFLAAMIDGAVVLMLGWVARGMAFTFFPMGAFDNSYFGIRFLLGLIVTYFYFGYFYSTKAASPGKLLLGLEVYDVDGHTKLTYTRAFLREALGKFISSVPLLMGYVIILIREDRRALHDLLFDTRVIKKP